MPIRKNEHQIQKAFEALTKDKTVLMIAHRLSTVQGADSIMVLSDGKIVERGSHEDLLARHGVYAQCGRIISAASDGKSGKEEKAI